MHASARDDRPRRIYNPVQRDAATFIETSEETGGVRTLVELEVAPGGKVTPHYHLTYSERFKVLEGQLTVEIDGVHHELEPGDEAVAAARSVHAWSNPGKDRSVVHVELRPGSPGFEKGLRVAYGLAADGLVLKNGVPRNPLHAALLLEMGEVRLPGVYAPLERVLGLLARVARWRGVDGELERRYL
jgi:quercetin dioxygenase-like cupin family protein